MGNQYGGRINAAVNMLIYRYEHLHYKKGDQIITVCGSYSHETKIHLERIQKALGLTVDGIFGINTLTAMMEDFQKNGEWQ